MSKDKQYTLNDDGSFVIKDYNNAYPFSNFLPGIAGAWGVPLWVFYVNRGQAVISFGLKDKDHAISEFFPANKAYCLVPLIGFRTFLKINGTICHEPFKVIAGHKREESMLIRSESLELHKINHQLGLKFLIKYFTLPNAPVAALVRILKIQNISRKDAKIEVLDGLPRVVPFGSPHLFLKDLARTLEAWMHASVVNNVATFKLLVNPRDTSQTKYIEGANFNYTFYEEQDKKIFPYIIVDPEVIFGQDTSFVVPVAFFAKHFKAPLRQVSCGKTPSAFSFFRWNLRAGQERCFYSVYGSSFKLELIKKFVLHIDSSFLKQKEEENRALISEIKNQAFCLSNFREFNHYLKNTYLDNIIRGGYPYTFDSRDVYYIFSRKHGDLERDYNKFKLLPSYFSEGEANYRDINQNRRIDLFFNPALFKKNIIYFLNFIKLDGYNPLKIHGEKLFLPRKDAQALLKEFRIADERVFSLLLNGFYLGEVFKLLKEETIELRDKDEFAQQLVSKAERQPQAAFGDGYWIDHWRYNLDLIENFLYFYPDKIKELFLDKEYLFWDDEYRIKERTRRYHLKEGVVYQGDSIEQVLEKNSIIQKRGRHRHFLRTRKNNIYQTNLIEKILTLILPRVCTLDPEGIGVEMEADKPGWCDSLNGLPALFGSSLCETLELKRASRLLIESFKELRAQGIESIRLCLEVFSFLSKVNNLLIRHLSLRSPRRDFLWWDESNRLKEWFREKTFLRIEGKVKEVTIASIEEFLKRLIVKLDRSIARAYDKKTNLYFTYFTYAVSKWRWRNKHIVPLCFRKKALPLFLEGPVHFLRVQGNQRGLYASLRKSALFDKGLGMYRLNASLKNEPLEIGRSRVFVPGWLENESIWLQMEYKYLLEVLRCGLYREFFADFYKCCVCFFEPQRYGRNPLENCSFIVSSAYPDHSLWGKGFVARLSGATVELLHIWMLLCLGKTPFSLDKNNELIIRLSPILKADFFTTQEEAVECNGKSVLLKANTFAFKLFSSILVVYHNPARRDTFENCHIAKIAIETKDNRYTIDSDTIEPPLSYAIRETKVERIDVYLV